MSKPASKRNATHERDAGDYDLVNGVRVRSYLRVVARNALADGEWKYLRDLLRPITQHILEDEARAVADKAGRKGAGRHQRAYRVIVQKTFGRLVKDGEAEAAGTGFYLRYRATTKLGSPPAVETVTLNGKEEYAAPLAKLFLPLSHSESEALRESVRERGVLVEFPVVTYDSPIYGPSVLDGLNRIKFAAEYGVTVPVVHKGAMTDEAARQLAVEYQTARRNITPEEQRQLRMERVDRIQAKRTAGKSLRTIAEEEGVSVAQVRRDLGEPDSGVPPGTPADPERGDASASPDPAGARPAQPLRIFGKDDKSYPPTRPAKPAPGPHQTPADERGGDGPTEAESVAVRAARAKLAAAAACREVVKLLRQVEAMAPAVAAAGGLTQDHRFPDGRPLLELRQTRTGGGTAAMAWTFPDVERTRRAVEARTPAKLCGGCGGEGCRSCVGGVLPTGGTAGVGNGETQDLTDDDFRDGGLTP